MTVNCPGCNKRIEIPHGGPPPPLPPPVASVAVVRQMPTSAKGRKDLPESGSAAHSGSRRTPGNIFGAVLAAILAAAAIIGIVVAAWNENAKANKLHREIQELVGH